MVLLFSLLLSCLNTLLIFFKFIILFTLLYMMFEYCYIDFPTRHFSFKILTTLSTATRFFVSENQSTTAKEQKTFLPFLPFIWSHQSGALVNSRLLPVRKIKVSKISLGSWYLCKMSGVRAVDTCPLSEESLCTKAQNCSATETQELCWELSPRDAMCFPSAKCFMALFPVLMESLHLSQTLKK